MVIEYKFLHTEIKYDKSRKALLLKKIIGIWQKQAIKLMILCIVA